MFLPTFFSQTGTAGLSVEARADPHLKNPFGDHALNMAAAAGSSEAWRKIRVVWSSGTILMSFISCVKFG